MKPVFHIYGYLWEVIDVVEGLEGIKEDSDGVRVQELLVTKEQGRTDDNSTIVVHGELKEPILWLPTEKGRIKTFRVSETP